MTEKRTIGDLCFFEIFASKQTFSRVLV